MERRKQKLVAGFYRPACLNLLWTKVGADQGAFFEVQIFFEGRVAIVIIYDSALIDENT